MLRGYFDESGHEGKGWVCVAGFVGNREQWNEFVPRWKAALGQRPTLHMNSLRWKYERTKRLLARLGPIPHACGLDGARGVVRVSDYADLVAGTDDERIYKGYIACLMFAVGQTLRGIPVDERIEFVFEQQREYEQQVGLVMAAFSHQKPENMEFFTVAGVPKIARWAFVPKGSTIMTDPADYLAFALREMHANPQSTKAKWCAPILQGKAEGYGGTLPRALVRRIVLGAQKLNEEQGLT